MPIFNGFALQGMDVARVADVEMCIKCGAFRTLCESQIAYFKDELLKQVLDGSDTSAIKAAKNALGLWTDLMSEVEQFNIMENQNAR